MPPYPGLLASLLLIGLGLVAAILSLVAGAALSIPPTPLILGSSLAGTGSALAVGLLCARLPWRTALGAGPHPGRGWLPLAPLLLGAVVLVSEVENLVRMVLPPPASFLESMQQILAPAGALERSLAFLAAGLMAPLVEELLFRGLMLRGLVSRHGPRAGIVFSAALFAAYHLYPWQAAPALALGCLFGWVALRSGRIGYAVALHVGNNLLALSLANFAPGLPGLSPQSSDPAHVPPLALALGAGLLVLGIRSFSRAFPGPARAPVAAGAP